MHISTGVVLPCQAERQRMPTTAPRCAHTPLLSMLAHTYTYLWNSIYLSWLASHAPCLHGENGLPAAPTHCRDVPTGPRD